jgi:phosphate transport system permease protein
VAFQPNPIDGVIFFVEPTRPLAATIVDNAEGLSVPPFEQTLYAFAAVLLISAAFLSFTGWYIRRALRRYTLSPI